jgi:limonene-1,2-epoxide hydrolase
LARSPTLAAMTELTGTSVANTRTVEGFLNALQEEDFETVDAALDDNLVYENVGLSRIRGGRRTTKLLRKMEGRVGFEVKVHRIAADGAAVITERTDALILGPWRVQFWACGVFEVHDGRITLWRDYVDVFDMLKGTVRGLVAVVIPSLRATL